MIFFSDLILDQIRPEGEASETAVTAVNQVPLNQNNGPAPSDDYFQSVVINSLLEILKDQSLNTHHTSVIEAIMSIFKTQGLKCVTFLPQVSALCKNTCSSSSEREG